MGPSTPENLMTRPLVLALLAGTVLAGFAPGLAGFGSRYQEAAPAGRTAIRGTQQGGREGRIPNSFYSDTVSADTHRDMQGVWRLEKLEWNGDVWDARDLAGFALIGPGHVALEVHARILVNTAEEMLVQTGIYRYDFNDVGELVLHALIGTDNIQEPLETSPTPPGQQSRYRVTLAEDVLILARPQSRMQLRRAIQPSPPFSNPKRERQLDRIERLLTPLDAGALEAIGDRIEAPDPGSDE